MAPNFVSSLLAVGFFMFLSILRVSALQSRAPSCNGRSLKSPLSAALLSMASSAPPSQSASHSATAPPQTPVPRAAVSTVVRFCRDSETTPTFLLIERGNPPNSGVWCVPGGKIEMGEATLTAAQRELAEEVLFEDREDIRLAWYSGSFCTSDSIVPGNPETGQPGSHYLIAQCFAEIVVPEGGGESPMPPKVEPADDARAARWWTLDEIRQAEAQQQTVPNLAIVIERAEALYQSGMLPTIHSLT